MRNFSSPDRLDTKSSEPTTLRLPIRNISPSILHSLFLHFYFRGKIKQDGAQVLQVPKEAGRLGAAFGAAVDAEASIPVRYPTF